MPTTKAPSRCITRPGNGSVPTGPVGRTKTIRIRASMHKLAAQYARDYSQAIRDVVEDALHHYIVTTDTSRKSKKRVSFGTKA